MKNIKIHALSNIDVKIPQYNKDLKEDNTFLEIYNNSNIDEGNNEKINIFYQLNFSKQKNVQSCSMI